MSGSYFLTLASISITSDCLWQATMLDGFKSPWQKQTVKGIAWICDTRCRKHLDFKSPQTGRVLLKFRATIPNKHLFRVRSCRASTNLHTVACHCLKTGSSCFWSFNIFQHYVYPWPYKWLSTCNLQIQHKQGRNGRKHLPASRHGALRLSCPVYYILKNIFCSTTYSSAKVPWSRRCWTSCSVSTEPSTYSETSSPFVLPT